jgi:hypothetical protein
VGLAGGTAHVTALKTVKPEVSVSVSWWDNIRELREVLSLAEKRSTDANPVGVLAAGQDQRRLRAC